MEQLCSIIEGDGSKKATSKKIQVTDIIRKEEFSTYRFPNDGLERSCGTCRISSDKGVNGKVLKTSRAED
jgi:hypothetical protein